MTFRYELVPSMVDGSLILQPRVLVKFTNPENGKSITVNALVDSGASISFLNIGLAEELGVDLTALPQGGVSSANKDDIAYYHDLKIHVQKDTREFLIPCGFMDFRTDAVIGQTGFFGIWCKPRGAVIILWHELTPRSLYDAVQRSPL
jgi:Aspartyl protease